MANNNMPPGGIGYTGPGSLPGLIQPGTNPKSKSKSSKIPKFANDPSDSGNILSDPFNARGVNVGMIPTLAGKGIVGTGPLGSTKPSSTGIDPLVSQLKFLQLIGPFIQQSIRDAVSGINSAADNYQQQVGGAYNDLDPSLQKYFTGMASPQAGADAIRNLGPAMAQQTTAQPQWDFLMSVINAYRDTQDQNFQLQRQLQQVMSGSNSSGMPSELAALLKP